LAVAATVAFAIPAANPIDTAANVRRRPIMTFARPHDALGRWRN
jgi:hypothetical protein